MAHNPPIWLILICISTQLHWALGGSSDGIPIIKQTDTNTSIVSTDTNSTNSSSDVPDHQHHYIVILKLILRPESSIPYIRDEIFYHNYAHNISTEDLIELSHIRELGLNETFEKLQALNISTNIFSVNSFKLLLDFVDMTFADFYEKLKSAANLTGPPLLEAFNALHIDSGNFSHAVTYGQPDSVYDVLSKGIYTIENFQTAATILGTDTDSFYMTVKNIILDQMKMKSLSYYGEKLKDRLSWVDKKLYDDVWLVFNTSLFDVYSVPNVRKIIDDLYRRLDQNITLGVVTSSHEIVVHKKIYNRMENVLKLVNINAVVVASPTIFYGSLTFIARKQDKFATLWSNDSIASEIDISEDMISKNDLNCTYITINDTQIIENQVKIVNTSDSIITVETENGTLFNVGNPLICQEKLVGLASRKHENNLFAFDTFYHSPKEVYISGFHDTNVIPIVFLHIIFLFTLRLIR